MSTPGDRVDPDVGPTRQQPSTGERMEQVELQLRVRKLKFLSSQDEMLDEANAMSKWDPEDSDQWKEERGIPS